MDELRWLLLIVGILLIAGVYGYGRYQEGRQGEGLMDKLKRLFNFKQRRNPLREQRADFDRALDELDSVVAQEDTEPELESVRIDEADREPHIAQPEPAPRADVPASDEPAVDVSRERPAEPVEAAEPPEVMGEEKIVVLNVVAPEGEAFTGPAVIHALEATGLRLGEHDIFHRSLDTRQGQVALFSVANILEPGRFDLVNIDQFETPGLAFFMRLPGPYDGLAAFEQMLACARSVADALGGRLLDSRRCNLTTQAVEHIREDLIEHRRRAHLAARQAR